MKAIVLLSQATLLALLSSCSTPPSSFYGTWATRDQARLTLVLRGDGTGNLYRFFPYEQTLNRGGPGAAQTDGGIPAISSPAHGTNALGQVALVQDDELGLLRWKKQGDTLVLSERGGVETALRILRKTETTLTVQPAPLRRPPAASRFRPGSLFDNMDSTSVVFTKSRDGG